MTVSRPLLGMIRQILSRLAELLQQLRCRPRPRPVRTPRNLPYDSNDCAWLYHTLYRSTTSHSRSKYWSQVIFYEI